MWTLYEGDCLEVMKGLPDNSIDSVVTDPPYELNFMGKKWDASGISYNVNVWREVLRVLKPGGHLLAFGGTRTYHRMTCAIEDAGFEIRDCIQWLYGSGFPKSMDISKAIDKKAGAERKIVGLKPYTNDGSIRGNSYNKGGYERVQLPITASATPEAEQWEGWGTCLKPANEPIVLARKPLSEKTIAENVMKWGTGGINVDGCRIETNGEQPKGSGSRKKAITGDTRVGAALGMYGPSGNFGNITPEAGRWPANVILDEEAGKMLDEQSGISKSSAQPRNNNDYKSIAKGYEKAHTTFGHSDAGGASRFFYCAKASKKERGEGNNHPTVKPLALMRYLVRLVTPPGGTVLDPFAGSGTTIIAAEDEGFSSIGIDLNREYCEIIRNRMAGR